MMLTSTVLAVYSSVCLISAVVILIAAIKQARRNDRADREIVQEIKLFMDKELEVITHFRHIVQDLIRFEPERAEILEVVDLELENRQEMSRDALVGLTALVAGNRREARYQLNLLKGKYPDAFGETHAGGRQ